MDYKDMNAIGIVRLMLTDGVITAEQAAKYFPELAEREDGRIRNFISNELACLRASDEKGTVRYNELTEAIAWLEKKGEQKSAAWCDEDETRLTNIIIMLKEGASLHFNKKDITKAVDWLKSFKDRVQPKQKWNYNDEIIIETIIQEIEKIPSEKFIDNAKNRCLDWLRYRTKSLRPHSKNEWSEEDGKMINSIAVHLNATTCGFPEDRAWADRFMNWLNSIKDRVQPQPKQEWSDEDKKRIEQICDDLKSGMINFYANEVVKGLHYKEIIESNIEWLKSLRPQSQWKPSKEMLESLEVAKCLSRNEVVRDNIEYLLNKLKKLKD